MQDLIRAQRGATAMWAIGLALVTMAGCIQVQQAEAIGDTMVGQDLGVTNDLVQEEPGPDVGAPSQDVDEPPAGDTTNTGPDVTVRIDVGTGEDGTVADPDIDDPAEDVEEPPMDIEEPPMDIEEPPTDLIAGTDIPMLTDVPPTVDTWTTNDTVGPTDVFQPVCDSHNQCAAGTECVDRFGFWPSNACITCRDLGNGTVGWARNSGVEPNDWAWYESMPPELPLGTMQIRHENLNDIRCDQDWRGWRLPFAAATTQEVPNGTAVPGTFTITAEYLSPVPGKAKQCVRFGCGRLLQGGNYVFDPPSTLVPVRCVDHNGATQTPAQITVPVNEPRFGQPSAGGTEYQCCVAAANTDLEPHSTGEKLRARLTVSLACEGDGFIGIWHGAYNVHGTQPLAACSVQPPDPSDTECLTFTSAIKAVSTAVNPTDL